MSEKWNLDQALSWVVWRDLDIVQDMEPGGYVTNKAYPSHLPVNDAPEIGKTTDLHTALKKGKLKAKGFKRIYIDTGKPQDADTREDIPAKEWSDLEIRPHNPAISQREGGAFSIRTDRAVWTGIEFNQDDVIKCFPEDGSNKTVETRGRNKGDGAIDDSIPLEKMHELITNNQAKSRNDAACQVVDDETITVGGNSTRESKIRRLNEKYSQEYPKES